MIEDDDPVIVQPGRHGAPRPVPIDAALSDDPDMWLVMADLAAWSAAHPCECEALCTCDGDAEDAG